MGFWIVMFAVALLMPLMMLFIGGLYTKGIGIGHVNTTMGYRTKMSMKNEETWAFAHRHFGTMWKLWGLILLPITIVGSVLCLVFFGQTNDSIAISMVVIIVVQSIVMMIPLFLTNVALKQTFDEDGKRRDPNYADEIRRHTHD